MNLIVLEQSESSALEALEKAYRTITEADIEPPSKRSKTARSYASGIKAYREWAALHNEGLPTKAALDRWRRDMEKDPTGGRGGKLSTSSINTRLQAMRSWLRLAAEDITDERLQRQMERWASVKNSKELKKQDLLEE